MIDGLLQPTHLILILVIALIVFGPGKVGEIGGQLGRGVRDFRANMEGGTRDATGDRFCTSCGKPAAAGQFCPACGAKQT
jgi:sec-independent protein translocase protein TatA